MLILYANQVEYCQVTCKVDDKVEVRPGIAYRNRLFVKGPEFPLAQKQAAIEQSRQDFAERQGLVYILLVIDGDVLTLWYQNDAATLTSKSAN